MKGISPLIATVLLIAFVVAVGGLLSVWLSSLTSSQTETVEAGGDALAKCATTNIIIEQVKYASSGTPPLVNITVSSIGSQVLKNLTMTVTGGGATTTSIKYFNATGSDFQPGSVFSASLNTSGGALLPPELVTASALCQNVRSVSDDCNSGDSCMIPV